MKIEKICISAQIPDRSVGDTFISWTVAVDIDTPEEARKVSRELHKEIYKEVLVNAALKGSPDTKAKMEFFLTKLEKFNAK